MRVAAKFTEFTFKELINRIENIINIQKTERHDQISRKIESILDNADKMNQFCQKNQSRNIDTGYLEFGTPIMVQSGGTYNLKIGAEVAKTVMVADTIILSICGKYKDFCANQSRTLIIDPIPEQKAAYEFLISVFDILVDELKIGKSFSEVSKKVREQAAKMENGHLAKFLPKVLGYGIGLKPKEELLAIKEDNEKIIEAGMVFNVRVSLANFDSKKRPNRNCL